MRIFMTRSSGSFRGQACRLVNILCLPISKINLRSWLTNVIPIGLYIYVKYEGSGSLIQNYRSWSRKPVNYASTGIGSTTLEKRIHFCLFCSGCVLPVRFRSGGAKINSDPFGSGSQLWVWCESRSFCHCDADPDPTFHFLMRFRVRILAVAS